MLFAEDFTAQGGTVAVHQFYETDTADFTEQLLARSLLLNPPLMLFFSQA